ncbi:hypothetical protein [Streptomyces sp. NPDC046887]|uniref:hypothetical protein n=1 Tax=Streptomyces sp. NPDC046887 TaxID=3155472 RepID=UPI0033FF214C
MPGTSLCLSCRTRLAEALVRLPGLYRECGERHFGSRRPAWERPPTPAGPPAVPLHAPAADVRRAVLGVLASWAGLTVQSSGLRAPRRTVADLCGFLHRHLGLLVRHPAAAELAAEVAALQARAERVAHPDETARVAVGPCKESGCGGLLTARPAQGRRRPARVSCDADPAHGWSVTESAARHNRTVAAPETTRGPRETAPSRVPRWLSQREVSTLWGVSSSSVYRLASERRWQRRRVSGRVYYAADDVRRALAPATA